MGKNSTKEDSELLTPLQAKLLEYLVEKSGGEFTSHTLSFAIYKGDIPFLRNSWIRKIGRRLAELSKRSLVQKRILRGMALYSAVPVYAKRTLEKYRRNIPTDRVDFTLF